MSASVLCLSGTWVHKTPLTHPLSPYDWIAGHEYEPRAPPTAPNAQSQPLDAHADRNSAYGGRPKGGMGVLCHTDSGCVSELVQRHTQWVRMPTADGTVFVCSVYAPQSTDRVARNEFWSELERSVPQYRDKGVVVIGGDFNGRLGVNGDTTVNAAGKEIQQFAARNGLVIVNTLPPVSGMHSFTRTTYDDQRKDYRVARSTPDYVLIDERHATAVQHMCIDAANDIGSDHKPITVRLRVSSDRLANAHPPPPPAPPRWRRHELDSNKESIELALDDDLSDWVKRTAPRIEHECRRLKLTAQQEADRYVSSFQERLVQSVESVVPKRHVKTASTYAAEAIASGRPLRARPHLFRSSAYDQCRATLRAVGWQLHLAHRRKDPEAERKLAAMREKLRKQCNRMHNELLALHQRKVLKELEQSQKCDKSFWKAWDRVRGTELGASELPKAVKCADGSIATNFANFVHAWSQHFASLGVPNRPATDSAREFADGVRAVMAELDPDLNEHARAKLECPITPDELAEHMRRLKRGKAVGHDQLPAEVLRLESPGLINALVLVFNRLLELVVWPTEWWYGLIVPIAKPGADRSDPNDYRGITVLPVLSKLFESVINERVAAFLEHTSGLSDLQGGFRANRGTMDQIFLLHEAMAQYRERKQPLYVAFLDVAKAYDKCWREGLAFRMRECGLTARIIHFFRQTQANVQRSVVVRGHTAPPIRFDTGVPQGAVTSPVLYAMFIDGLARELERSECGAVVSGQHLPALLYADDIALLASSPERLQRLLDICSDYALRYQFEFNAAKSNVVMIASKAQCERAQHQSWTLQASRDPALKQAQHYKYLGVIMGNTGEGGKRWQPTLDALNRKAMGSARVVQQVAGTGKRAACVAVQIKLFRAIVVPALEYACAVWGPALSGTQRTELDRTQEAFLRSVLYCGLYAAGAFNRGEAGLRTLTNHCDELALRLFGHLYSLSITDRDRILGAVFRGRLREAWLGGASRSWCDSMRAVFARYNLTPYFTGEKEIPSREEWAHICREATLLHSNQQWCREVASKSTLQLYSTLKSFPQMEVALRGGNNSGGRDLKLMVRAGVLPINARAAQLHRSNCYAERKRKYGLERSRTDPAIELEHAQRSKCKACDSGEAEDIYHFVFRCSPAQHQLLESKLHDKLQQLSGGVRLWEQYLRMTEHDRLRVLLGATFDAECDRPQCDTKEGEALTSLLRDAAIRAAIDREVKNFLLVRWRNRCDVAGVPRTVSFKGSFAVVNDPPPNARAAPASLMASSLLR